MRLAFFCSGEVTVGTDAVTALVVTGPRERGFGHVDRACGGRAPGRGRAGRTGSHG
jgi:hypothetical protein